MPRVSHLLLLLAALWLGGAQAAVNEIAGEAYGFPLTNPFEATIATTPPELRPALPELADIDQADYSLRLRPRRELPDNFWAVKKLRYRLARQAGPAPLVFIISGTGAHYANGKTEELKRLYYGAGYHVVQLSSPTSYDFMAAASRHATPGISDRDAIDLYRVMERIREQQRDLPVTDWYLTGYSLGGLHAAFVSRLDEERQAFNFRRVLLINPPVNLYTSVSNLDRLVQTEVRGIDSTRTFYDLVLGKLARYFEERGAVEIDAAMLYDFQQSRQRLSDEEMAMLIGAAFRFAAADIAFTSDLINRRGVVLPPTYPMDEGTSLTPFFKRALLCDFECYIREQLLPYWRAQGDGNSLLQLIDQVSLYSLQGYLAGSDKIAVFHNRDDLILGPGDLGFLRRTLGARLTLFPRGGHCGNMNYRVNTQAMLEFFRD
ncbi:serine/threonine protein kinase [Pseudomonas sp. AN-1]|uniref:serine/threonine protein kinase n=1 Tax=Pseudomonas sp. AN-1 TaxID=3096605 RepID=UPI002A6AB368|nr:serine/threonine protein kinase [Pseudomonas sp. AN-1]WPP45775.1 serine/threonine protein kinase [Pseudomonas sp. AN-1]